jgi:PAS domain S-box-containing protein
MNDRQSEIDYDLMLQQLQKQARQLEISAQVSRQLTAALDLDRLLLQVVELIKESFDYYHVHIYLLDPESGYLIMREGSGDVGAVLKSRDHRIPLGRGMVGSVGKTGTSLLSTDVSQQPNWLPNPLLPETRSELTVSLQIGDQILGVLDVQSNEIAGLTETDMSLMESLGQQIAVAVQNALLFRETRAVSIISRAISSELGIEQVFAAISRELKQLIGFDYMTVATYYESENQVELVGVDDRTAADIPLEEGVQFPVDLCVPGMAVREGRSIIASDLTAEPFSTFIDAEILTRRGMRSVLSVPLVSRGRTMGAINLVSIQERAFTASDVHLMEQVSGQLASALENAQIFERVQQMVDERTSESAIFGTMVENSSEAIALANVQQILTNVNPAFYRIHGYDPEVDDLIRRPLTSFIVCEDQVALSDELHDYVLGGRLWRAEVQHRRKDGTSFHAVTTIFAVRDQDGEPMAIAALTRDVSAERKIMEISQAASSTPELGRLAPLALECIAADTDIDRAILILYDEITEAGPQNMSLVAVYDPESGGRRAMDEHLTAQDSPFSTVVYHERKAVFVADVSTDERLFEEGRALLLEHGILSMLALPIMVRDKVVGMVGIDWREHVELTYDEIALYQTMVNQVSTAVENARLIALQQEQLEQTLDRRVREVATSIEVGQAIAAAPKLEELFSRVVTLIKERFGYYHAHVYQVDLERNDLEMMAGYGEPGRILRERGHRIPMGAGLVGTAAVTGELVRVADVSKQKNWLPNPLLPDTRSELAVPIRLGDKVLGVLDVQSDQLEGLTEDDELLLLGLCGQIAVSIQNTQSLEDLQRSQISAQKRAQQLELSAGVSEQLAANLDQEKLLSAVVNLIQQGFDYYHVHVYLIDEDTGDLVMMEGTGEPGRIMKERGHRIPAGKGLVGLAVTTKVAVLVSDVSEHEGWLPNPLLPNTRSELSMPFKLGEKVVGVLDVQDAQVNGLTKDDQSLLEGLAGQIAIALQNARIFGQIEDQVMEQTQEVRVFQSLAENAADSITMADLNGRIFYANAAWYDLYGYDPETGQDMDVMASDVWPSEAMEWLEQAVQQRTFRECRTEATQLRQDGARVTIDLTLFVVRDGQGHPSAVAALGRDITLRKMTDQVTRLVSTASSQSELGVKFLQAVMRGVNADRGSFVLYEGEDGSDPRAIRIVASYDDHAQDVLEVDRTYALTQDPIYSELYHTQEPVIYNDLGELEPQRRALLQKARVRSIAAFPLFFEEGRVGGALVLERQRALPFTDEGDFLSPLLQQASLAVWNLIFRDAQERQTQEMLAQRTKRLLLRLGWTSFFNV